MSDPIHSDKQHEEYWRVRARVAEQALREIKRELDPEHLADHDEAQIGSHIEYAYGVAEKALDGKAVPHLSHSGDGGSEFAALAEQYQLKPGPQLSEANRWFLLGRFSAASATEFPMCEQELTLLIDYHDNQDAGAEAADCPEASLYHAKRSAAYSAMRDAIKKRDADTLAKMVASDTLSPQRRIVE